MVQLGGATILRLPQRGFRFNKSASQRQRFAPFWPLPPRRGGMATTARRFSWNMMHWSRCAPRGEMWRRWHDRPPGYPRRQRAPR